MLLQKNIVKKYLALLPDEQTQKAWKWVREPLLHTNLFSNIQIFNVKNDQ